MSNCHPFEIVGRDFDVLCRRMRFTFGGRQVRQVTQLPMAVGPASVLMKDRARHNAGS